MKNYEVKFEYARRNEGMKIVHTMIVEAKNEDNALTVACNYLHENDLMTFCWNGHQVREIK